MVVVLSWKIVRVGVISTAADTQLPHFSSFQVVADEYSSRAAAFSQRQPFLFPSDTTDARWPLHHRGGKNEKTAAMVERLQAVISEERNEVQRLQEAVSREKTERERLQALLCTSECMRQAQVQWCHQLLLSMNMTAPQQNEASAWQHHNAPVQEDASAWQSASAQELSPRPPQHWPPQDRQSSPPQKLFLDSALEQGIPAASTGSSRGAKAVPETSSDPARAPVLAAPAPGAPTSRTTKAPEPNGLPLTFVGHRGGESWPILFEDDDSSVDGRASAALGASSKELLGLRDDLQDRLKDEEGGGTAATGPARPPTPPGRSHWRRGNQTGVGASSPAELTTGQAGDLQRGGRPAFLFQ